MSKRLLVARSLRPLKKRSNKRIRFTMQILKGNFRPYPEYILEEVGVFNE